MKEIIYDLLCVGKSHKTFTINPEVKLTKADDAFPVLSIDKFSFSAFSCLPRG